MTQTKSKAIEDRLAALEAKVDTKQITRALVIQDKSSSMGGRVKQTIDGYNEYISSLKDDDSDELFLTLVQFDHEYSVVEDGTPIDKVEPLDHKRYQVRGSTAMLDAIGRGINGIKNDMDKGDRALVVIMTDGEENSSTEFDTKAINKLIDKCEKDGNWSFVFLGAGRDAWQGGQSIGLRRGQSVFYGEDGHSHETAYAGLSGMTSSLRSSNVTAMASTGASISNIMSEKGADVELEDEDGGEKES